MHKLNGALGAVVDAHAPGRDERLSDADRDDLIAFLESL